MKFPKCNFINENEDEKKGKRKKIKFLIHTREVFKFIFVKRLEGMKILKMIKKQEKKPRKAFKCFNIRGKS